MNTCKILESVRWYNLWVIVKSDVFWLGQYWLCFINYNFHFWLLYSVNCKKIVVWSSPNVTVIIGIVNVSADVLIWLQIYLGGLLTFNMNGISVKYNFNGCMDNVVFNGVRMIRDTRNGYQGFSMVGVMPDPWNCKVRLETARTWQKTLKLRKPTKKLKFCKQHKGPSQNKLKKRA